MMIRKLGKETINFMDKERILESSRRENKNRDLVELEAAAHAGNIAGRVGATVCILLFLVFRFFTGTCLFSPWIIYFSILAAHSLVRYTRLKKTTDLLFSVLYAVMCLLFLVLFILRLVEVKE